MNYYIIIVEGRTDSSLIEAILNKEFSFKWYEKKSEMPEIFKRMIGQYPVGGESLRFEGSPTFFHKNQDIGVAVKISSGIKKIPDTIDGLMAVAGDYVDFKGFIIITDTDINSHDKIVNDFSKQCNSSGLGLVVSGNKIINADGCETDFSLYNIPQTSYGAVEKLILECVKISEFI